MATGHANVETVKRVGSYTLVLTPDEAEYLLGLVSALKCRPIMDRPEFNYEIYKALLNGAKVPQDELYEAARDFAHGTVR